MSFFNNSLNVKYIIKAGIFIEFKIGYPVPIWRQTHVPADSCTCKLLYLQTHVPAMFQHSVTEMKYDHRHIRHFPFIRLPWPAPLYHDERKVVPPAPLLALHVYQVIRGRIVKAFSPSPGTSQ